MTSPSICREGDRVLRQLAAMIRQKNAADRGVAEIIERPALSGHFGEFVAAKIFDIRLHRSAATAGSDGVFGNGPLRGRSVNIKYYTRHERLLDLKTENGPDYYLVMTGPPAAPVASRRQIRPWVIVSVFVFEAVTLLSELRRRNPRKRIGLATYVPADLWNGVEVYPCNSALLPLEQSQKDMIALFCESAVD